MHILYSYLILVFSSSLCICLPFYLLCLFFVSFFVWMSVYLFACSSVCLFVGVLWTDCPFDLGDGARRWHELETGLVGGRKWRLLGKRAKRKLLRSAISVSTLLQCTVLMVLILHGSSEPLAHSTPVYCSYGTNITW